MWNELGISGGTAIVILIALYFVIKWAVKNGIKEAYSAITGKKTDEDIKNEKELKELSAIHPEPEKDFTYLEELLHSDFKKIYKQIG